VFRVQESIRASACEGISSVLSRTVQPGQRSRRYCFRKSVCAGSAPELTASKSRSTSRPSAALTCSYSTTGSNCVLGRAGTPGHLPAATGRCGGSLKLPNKEGEGWTNPVIAATSPLWTVSTLMAKG
jgi:hypothetical protein